VGKALDALAKAYRIDPKRTYLLGFSEGAFLTAHCMMLHAGRIAGAIIIGGGLDRELLREEDFPKLQGKRILIAHGSRTWWSRSETARRFRRFCRRTGSRMSSSRSTAGTRCRRRCAKGCRDGCAEGDRRELKAEEPK